MALKLVTAASAPLVTLADVKRHVRAEDFADDDSYLEALVEVATAHIDAPSGWLGRAIGASTWELKLDGFPIDERINIPLPPLQEVISVTYVDTAGDEQTYTGFRAFGIGAANAPGFVLPAYDDDWPDTLDDEPESVRVRFEAGYETTPRPIKHAILLMVGGWYANREDAAEIKLAEMPRGVDALLRPFQVWA